MSSARRSSLADRCATAAARSKGRIDVSEGMISKDSKRERKSEERKGNGSKKDKKDKKERKEERKLRDAQREMRQAFFGWYTRAETVTGSPFWLNTR